MTFNQAAAEVLIPKNFRDIPTKSPLTVQEYMELQEYKYNLKEYLSNLDKLEKERVKQEIETFEKYLKQWN